MPWLQRNEMTHYKSQISAAGKKPSQKTEINARKYNVIYRVLYKYCFQLLTFR